MRRNLPIRLVRFLTSCYNRFMEKLSSSEDVAKHKLLILYILGKLKISVSGIELADYIINERLMDYLMFRQRIHELAEAGHVSCFRDNGADLYGITAGGEKLLAQMQDAIPGVKKVRVDRTIGKLSRVSMDGRSVIARYVPEDVGRGRVHLELNEGGVKLLSLDIATASDAEAAAIRRNWISRADKIYAGIAELLLETTGAEPLLETTGAEPLLETTGAEPLFDTPLDAPDPEASG